VKSPTSLKASLAKPLQVTFLKSKEKSTLQGGDPAEV